MRVSVVVTVLNEEDTIDKLLKAFLNQTKRPTEIIIVDGGSTDKTIQLINQFKKDPSIKLIEKRGNRAVGRNYGIAQAKNDIIAVTDAGGYPKEEWLEEITAPFNEPKVVIVSGYYKPLTKTSFEKSVVPYFAAMPDKISRKMEFLPSSRSVAFRKSIWAKIGGYPEQYSHNEDLVFDYNLKKIGVRFFFEPNAIVYWYPPRELFSAAKQFFRFAYGDAQAGIRRPKIRFIFLRYGAGALLLSFGFYQPLSFLVVLYIAWAIGKNFRYIKSWKGIFWLPLIQVVSDVAVMAGFLAGVLKR